MKVEEYLIKHKIKYLIIMWVIVIVLGLLVAPNIFYGNYQVNYLGYKNANYLSGFWLYSLMFVWMFACLRLIVPLGEAKWD